MVFRIFYSSIIMFRYIDKRIDIKTDAVLDLKKNFDIKTNAVLNKTAWVG